MMAINQEILKVNEIFKSIQGEGTQSGHPMLFIRLSGCNLQCIYCDTPNILKPGMDYSLEKLLNEVNAQKKLPVYITGGEPLIQPVTPYLVDELINAGYEVFVDTNGTMDVGVLNELVNKIIDIKTPGSQSGGKFLESNLDYVAPRDEIKFVITSRDDFEWSIEKIDELNIFDLTPNVIFQPAWGILEPRDLAMWIISSDKPVRLLLQIHKHIWGPNATGV